MATKKLSKKGQQPMFNGGNLDVSPPPYSFEGVTLRYLPLKANFHTLANFCDEYLNLAPEFAYFRPSAPFVLLIVVNYGRMSQQLGNFGWTSQNELLFTVPVDWYRRENGKLVFHNMATVAPFIFVDNDSSQSAGREILGWPKAPGWFSSGIDSWAEHPRNRREVLTLTTRVFDELYEGETSKARELLVIEEDPDPTFTEFPPDPMNPLNPLVSIPKAVVNWSKLFFQGVDMMTRLPMRGYTSPLDRRTLDNIRKLMQSGGNTAGGVQGNTINLKQMRDAAEPKNACYQAITNAKLEVTQFHRGGMLGDNALLRGDLSGGYRVRLNDYESQPIVSTLGLEVEEKVTHGDDETSYYLRPIMPFWQEMDMRYVAAENLCWRAHGEKWRNDDPAPAPKSDPKPDPEPESRPEPEPEANSNAPQHHLFNTTGPSALHVATGPFRFTNMTSRVLPLLADPDTLDKLIAKRFAVTEGVGRFEAYGRYVYMVVNSYDRMYSETNDLGRWAGKTVEFLVPVLWRNDKDGSLITAGYFCPYIFNNSAIGVTTAREVYGWPAAEAQIQSPNNVWLAADGPAAEIKPLLDVKALVYPALGVGQESQWRTLIEVDDGNLHDEQDQDTWHATADAWGKNMKSDVERMAKSVSEDQEGFLDLKTLALEILGNGEGINQFSFKEFRDAKSTELACYQALVKRRSTIERLHDLRELEDRSHVKLHFYPTHPIVNDLGLVVQSSYLTDTGRVDCLQPSRHFFLKSDIRTELPKNICMRSLSDWTVPEHETGYFEEKKSAGVGSDLTRFLDDPEVETGIDPDLFRDEDRNPRRLRHKCKLWLDNTHDKSDESQRMSRKRAAEVVGNADFEPQTVIHSILSSEWENHGCPRWRQAEKQKERGEAPVDQLPTFVLRRDSVGSASDELFPESVPNVGTDDDYWSPDDN